jgi:hypothetical protein
VSFVAWGTIGLVRVAPADWTPLTCRTVPAKAGLREWTTMTPIRSYVVTTVPPASDIALFTRLTAPWPPRVFTTYDSIGPSAGTVAVGSFTEAADAVPMGRRASEAVSASPTGSVSTRARRDAR